MLESPFEDEVFLHVPNLMRPSDDLRKSACEKLFPGMQDIKSFLLPSAELQLFSTGMQKVTYALMYPKEGGMPDQDTFGNFYAKIPVLGQLYQYLALCHIFTDEEVQSSMDTQQIMGTETDFHISHLFQLLVDYTIEKATTLWSTTNAQDLEQAKNPTTAPDLAVAYRARVAQRDLLAQWRHAFCQRHGFPSQHAEVIYDHFVKGPYQPYLFVPNLPLPNAPDCLLESRGCRYCGATLWLKFCNQCKLVQYCSKEHQKSDWKVHKHFCIIKQEGKQEESKG
jgi:MYND finger